MAISHAVWKTNKLSDNSQPAAGTVLWQVFIFRLSPECAGAPPESLNKSNCQKVNRISLLKPKGDTDMTQGNIVVLLLRFSLPLMIGNVFQQLYNAVDSIVVGNFVGKQALAAVGCTGPIINAFIGFFMGLASGAGVVISQYYGAKDDDRLHRSVQTTVTVIFILSIILTFLGVKLTPGMIRLMDTPADVVPEAEEYLRIYFLGVSGLLFYNIGAGILRAVGDSTHPLYYLIFSACSNTVLDVLFVKYFNMGIAGAAYATILAQFMSAVLVMGMLAKTKAAYRVQLTKPCLDRDILGRIFSIGLPSAVQMAITAFSNVFVQGYINHFESSCMAGWAAYNKIDSFAMLPLVSLSMGVTTFTGQNLGAGNVERTNDGLKKALKMGFAMMIVLLAPLIIFAPQLTGLFNKDEQVIAFGTLFIRLCSPFYLAFVVNQLFRGFLSGVGDTKAAMYIMLGSFVAFRQVYLFVVSRLGGGIVAIASAYPAGWVLCTSLFLVYYLKGGWRKKLPEYSEKKSA